MSAGKTPFELMMEQAQEMAKAFNPALETFSPKGYEALWPTMPKEMMEMAFGRGISKEGLDAKTRLLLTIAGLTMQGAQAETPFRMTVRHAMEAGATKDEIAETIAQMSMFAGLPAMNRAMELARDVMDDQEDDEQ
ncbi:MAG: carboxymuconolactone decarboxylase family protein [Marinovum algicola]|jgi:4-carboxymuconolactone decarboxylase|uniref:4-carboxymuconolactone decarboxylase n=1 Tax=Marinovum algicola TaxID=42444 RepID=A0A975ZP57_9RHOB|nr:MULTISPECIES: carboxymuconolactone decarboxylase family protein [Marinovum]AKO97513.1 putative gamma-carboxymuconolactone decarboxylase subunit-like protein [Marinovum algicola DG 898]MDD9738602.1 carboxymuconolactone decarboxylase family protein [Marinovum sp. SP66]MDD9744430.1 carboxymuconolactone decarboxylase family protein [Marinovum sp. PR37]SEJ77622.1 4-carboxymuconolactone decarboxylase [Marinovum algicola]SLN59970.1 Carboxymuconolactone decarboxylase family protein [Marinovum algic